MRLALLLAVACTRPASEPPKSHVEVHVTCELDPSGAGPCFCTQTDEQCTQRRDVLQQKGLAMGNCQTAPLEMCLAWSARVEAWTITKSAARSAQIGDCGSAVTAGKRVEALDADLYSTVYRRDSAIAKCLRDQDSLERPE